MSEENQQQMMTYEEFAEVLRLTLVDLVFDPYRPQERLIGKYKLQDLKLALTTPEYDANQRILRAISKYAYNVSQHYKRLLHYFAELLLFNFYVEPYGSTVKKSNQKSYKKTFENIIDVIERMNLRHEFGKIMLTVYREGVYFGYIHEDNDHFFFQQLDADYCKIIAIENGMPAIAFNFNYFFVYPERLKFFPQEFQDLYAVWTDATKGKKLRRNSTYWLPLNSQNTICIKHDEAVYFPIPPFIDLFANILEIEDFKDLRKNKDEIDNYKLLALKIPLLNNNEPNKMGLSADWVKKYYQSMRNASPQQVGVVAVPMDIEQINFERDRPDINRVADVTEEYWNRAGVSSLLFQANATSIGLNNSIRVDENNVFGFLRQFEHWLNNYLERFSGKFKFRTVFLDMTRFNVKDVQTTLQQSATFGAPKIPWLASLGYTPSAVENLLALENDVLELSTKLIPLQSSHTQSGDGTQSQGRPEMDIEDLSEKGLENRDQERGKTRAQ